MRPAGSNRQSVQITLYPPLNTAAGRDRVSLSLEGAMDIGWVIEALIGRFGEDFRKHFYDDEERLIPAWCFFVDQTPVQLNRPGALRYRLQPGAEISILLALAGG